MTIVAEMGRDCRVHPSAFVDEGAHVGAGTKIWHFCHVQRGATIGERCVLGQNVNVGEGAVVGGGVKIQNNVSVYSGVHIEDDVFLGPSCVFTNVRNPRAAVERKDDFRPTRVGRGATVGANATVVCGCDLGCYSMVGAGAVVTRSVPANALVVGVPARLAGWVCRCGEVLVFDGAVAGCPCGDRYRKLGANCGFGGDRYRKLGLDGAAVERIEV